MEGSDMPRHSLYPAFVKIRYTSNGHPHDQVLPVSATPAAAGASFTIPNRGGSPVDWATAVDAYVVVMKAIFAAESSIDFAELFELEATTAPPSFLASHPIGVAGTHGAAPVPFAQVVVPFKGLGGGGMRPYYLETPYPNEIRESYPSGDTALDALIAWVLGANDVFCTRGGGFPAASLGFVTKINDELRKRYFNP